MSQFLPRINNRRGLLYWLVVAGAVTLCGSARPQGFFVLAKHEVTINGGTFDSFDSSDPTYSTNGRYDPTKAKDGCVIGTIATNSIGAITITNNARINGSAAAGLGSTFFLSGSAGVGTSSWISGGHSGIQPGHFRADLNAPVPDVQTPLSGSVSPLPGLVDGTNYAYVLSGAVGRYQMATFTMSSSQRMVVIGNVTLYVVGSLTLTGQSYIYIYPGASLRLYCRGNMSIAGGGIFNSSDQATNCILYGLPTCLSWNYAASAPLVGIVYAPEAALSLTGAFTGALVADSVLINPSACHYDEAIAGAGLINVAPPTLGPALPFSGNQFQFQVAGTAGFQLAVEASTNLLDWVSLQTNGAPFLFSDPETTSLPRRFYRAVYRP